MRLRSESATENAGGVGKGVEGWRRERKRGAFQTDALE